MDKIDRPIFGGWTPTYEGDLCKGGHPPQSIRWNDDGERECHRCGRLVDPSPCLCGEESHRSGLSRSMCPNRMRMDQRDAENFKWIFSLGPQNAEEIDPLQYARLVEYKKSARVVLDAYRQRMTELILERDQLKRWKREALHVIGEWDKVYDEVVGSEDGLQHLGRFKWEVVLEALKRLEEGSLGVGHED